MNFLEVIEKKISRAEDEFVASSNNSLNNCGQLLDYIQALKNIQSMYITEPSVADSNHTDLVNIKGATNSVAVAVNNGVSTIVSSLSTINNNLSTINTKLDKLNTVISKLDSLNSTSQLTLDELKNTNDYLKVANDYLKTISEK